MFCVFEMKIFLAFTKSTLLIKFIRNWAKIRAINAGGRWLARAKALVWLRYL
jgi:hypothetical protein